MNDFMKEIEDKHWRKQWKFYHLKNGQTIMYIYCSKMGVHWRRLVFIVLFGQLLAPETIWKNKVRKWNSNANTALRKQRKFKITQQQVSPMTINVAEYPFSYCFSSSPYVLIPLNWTQKLDQDDVKRGSISSILFYAKFLRFLMRLTDFDGLRVFNFFLHLPWLSLFWSAVLRLARRADVAMGKFNLSRPFIMLG